MKKSPARTDDGPFELRTHESMRDIGEAEYARLVDHDTPPFLSFAWLDALEVTGCAVPARGWAPIHLALYRASELVAFAPVYVKGNSEGEFVFDHGWARFATAQLRTEYYPKLIVAVPFTPATGPRVLCAPGVSRDVVVAAFAAGLERVVQELGLSSAHVLFPPESEALEFGRAGYLRRYGLQFHWRNANYTCFNDFLTRFSAKRRHQIRRERREMELNNIAIRTFTGADIGTEQVDLAYEFYTTTVQKYYWGRQYLTRGFFEEIAARMPEQLHIVLAHDRGSKQPLGGAFNLLGRRALYGRYWGAREDRPFLHFNVCFYHSIEDCILRKLELFEPGAGGEHKVSRGFEPTLTHSAHYLKDPRLRGAVADFLERERCAYDQHIQEAAQESVLKPL